MPSDAGAWCGGPSRVGGALELGLLLLQLCTDLLQRDGLNPLHGVDIEYIHSVLTVHRQVGRVVAWTEESSIGSSDAPPYVISVLISIQTCTHRRRWAPRATWAPAAGTGGPESPRTPRWSWSTAAAPCWRSPRRRKHPGSAAGWRPGCGPRGGAGWRGTRRHGHCGGQSHHIQKCGET